MFDLNDSVELILPTGDGEKICLVRHPTDAEWTKRFNTRYTLIRNLNGGATEQKPMKREEADSELLNAIQLNKEVEFDDAEAIVLIDQLANSDVTDVQRSPGHMHICLETPLGEVEHDIKIPNHKELRFTVEACAKMRGGKFNTTTIHLNLPPAAELYDRIAEVVTGYSTDKPTEVPIVHKYKIIDVLNGEISQFTARAKAKSGEEFPTIPGRKVPA